MKKMDHENYPKKLKKLSVKSLRWIIQDAAAALAAMPENSNAGYYADEIHYCAAELRIRGIQ